MTAPGSSEGAALPRRRFPKAARLATAGEFRRVKEQGRSWPGRLMVLGVLTDTPAATTRIGLITSRRVGGAVVRNRVRRLLRECVRAARPRLRPNCWLVIIARHTAARATLAELSAEWLRLARRASILAPAPASVEPRAPSPLSAAPGEPLAPASSEPPTPLPPSTPQP